MLNNERNACNVQQLSWAESHGIIIFFSNVSQTLNKTYFIGRIQRLQILQAI